MSRSEPAGLVGKAREEKLSRERSHTDLEGDRSWHHDGSVDISIQPRAPVGSMWAEVVQ